MLVESKLPIRLYTNSWPFFSNSTINRTIRIFHRTFATGVAYRQGALTPPDTWSRPIWDKRMLLRPFFPNFSLFFRTMLFEHPSVLSRFCSKCDNGVLCRCLGRHVRTLLCILDIVVQISSVRPHMYVPSYIWMKVVDFDVKHQSNIEKTDIDLYVLLLLLFNYTTATRAWKIGANKPVYQTIKITVSD